MSNSCVFSRFVVSLIGFSVFVAFNCNGEKYLPSEEEIDRLAYSIGENMDAQGYFISFDQKVVPIVTKKLLGRLAMPASAQGTQASALMDMPQAERNSAKIQSGLLVMQQLALEKMSLENETRTQVEESLLIALKSPYEVVRFQALNSVGSALGSRAVEHVLPLLDDRSKFNRILATNVLRESGDAKVADEIEKILARRRSGLTDEQVKQDRSFQRGYEAVRELRNNKSSEASIGSLLAQNGQTPRNGKSSSTGHEVRHSEQLSNPSRGEKLVTLAVCFSGVLILMCLFVAGKVWRR